MLRRLLIITLVTLACVIPSQAAQMTITEDITTANGLEASYTGPDGNLGYSVNGNYDAFDGYGVRNNYGGLTLQRRVEAITSINVYRWLDIFTNNTAAPIALSTQFHGDLGSDGFETVEHSDSYYMVSHDGQTPFQGVDAVIAHVRGNNAWAAANMNGSVAAGYYDAVANISLAPGESIGLLHFAFLARDTSAQLASDTTLAINRGQELVDDPYLDGFTPAELATIANFTVVPEPATVALLAMGALGLLRRRTR